MARIVCLTGTLLIIGVALVRCCSGAEILVAPGELATALHRVVAGDHLVLEPGVHAGGGYRAGLRDVTIRSRDPGNRAIIHGGGNGIQLSAAQNVTLEDLVFEQQEFNGINIDDGSNADTPSTNITLRRLTLRDIGSDGNHDAVKLSGVDGFVLDQLEVLDCGDGGSAVDMVGSHHGLVQNSHFKAGDPKYFGSAIRPKGGSKDITIRANRVELPIGSGRAIQAGGSTGAAYFRFVDGESNYEADEIIAEGNVVIGGISAFSWVNIDGGLFHHNYVERPGNWTLRILNQNPNNSMIDTQNGVWRNNVIVFNDTANEYRSAVNVGSETLPQTFKFHANRWFNQAAPTARGSTPQLPTPETGAVHGVNPRIDANAIIPWEFPWGLWLVNASPVANRYELQDAAQFFRAIARDEGARFVPSQDHAFEGNWSYEAVTDPSIRLEPFSQRILTRSAKVTRGAGD